MHDYNRIERKKKNREHLKELKSVTFKEVLRNYLLTEQ